MATSTGFCRCDTVRPCRRYPNQRRSDERHGFEPVELGDGSGNEEHQADVRYAWRP
jgi:hypothetical protein